MRMLEHDVVWLSEAERETVPTKDFIADMVALYKKMMCHIPIIVDNIDISFDAECRHPNDSKSIYGEVVLSMVVDTSKHSIKHYAEMFTRRAYLLNYNMVDFNSSKQ